MNYNHLYHAGNFADIAKHLTLILCLEEFHKKSEPFLAIDTHAGIGKYDLDSTESKKTNEAENGIFKFLKNLDYKNPHLKNYLKILAKINIWKSPIFIDSAADQSKSTSSMQAQNKTEKLKFYPGSPYIIKYFLRGADKAIFCEIKNQEFIKLKRNFAGNPKTKLLNTDGFDLLTHEKITAKNGLILIDPAFEKNSNQVSKDYNRTIELLKQSSKTLNSFIHLVWHPIINKQIEKDTLDKFYKDFNYLQFKDILHITFQDDKNELNKMSACGLFIMNAPDGLTKKLLSIFGNKMKIRKILPPLKRRPTLAGMGPKNP